MNYMKIWIFVLPKVTLAIFYTIFKDVCEYYSWLSYFFNSGIHKMLSWPTDKFFTCKYEVPLWKAPTRLSLDCQYLEDWMEMSPRSVLKIRKPPPLPDYKHWHFVISSLDVVRVTNVCAGFRYSKAVSFLNWSITVELLYLILNTSFEILFYTWNEWLI